MAADIQALGIAAEAGRVLVRPGDGVAHLRGQHAEIAVRLTPAITLSLEQCLDFLEPDELLEVTPASLRLRKRILDATQRRRQTASAR